MPFSKGLCAAAKSIYHCDATFKPFPVIYWLTLLKLAANKGRLGDVDAGPSAL